jgi:hypothetical protein
VAAVTTFNIDPVAREHLDRSGTSIEHMVEHHRRHLASDCRCLFGKDGETAMQHPDGTVLIISEPKPDLFVITGHRPEGGAR